MHKVLLVGEAVTLAHIARPLVYARQLALHYQVSIACDTSVHHLVRQEGWEPLTITSLPASQFVSRLKWGKCVFKTRELIGNVHEDMRLLQAFKPDLVIGDFRLSLSISCRLANIPYVGIGNAYWYPGAIGKLPVPELPLTHIFGVRYGQWLFDRMAPSIMKSHCARYNRVRNDFGLDVLSCSLGEIYLDADYTALVDLQECYENVRETKQYRFVGPCVWEPPNTLPEWWGQLDESKPTVFLTLGSSGQVRVVSLVVRAFVKAGWNVMLATAGRRIGGEFRGVDGVYVADFLPGRIAVDRAAVVVCNGGSPVSQLAMVAGKPVIGIPSNLDQCLNMAMVRSRHLGIELRPEVFDADSLNDVISTIMNSPEIVQCSRKYGEYARDQKYQRKMPELVAEALGASKY